MVEIESDPYHAEKFLKMRKRWAQRGMRETGIDEGEGQEYLGFKVHLD